MSVANPSDGAEPSVGDGSEAKPAGGPEHDLIDRPRPTISTHVLDTGSGRPAEAVHVTLYKLGEEERPIRLTQALTDADGRVADLLDRPLSPGVYRIEFKVGRPGGPGVRGASESVPAASTLSPFFQRLAVDVRVDDISRSYHVPLLLSPYSLTIYRGS
jgi:5-hydroxyisourate hydrolase